MQFLLPVDAHPVCNVCSDLIAVGFVCKLTCARSEVQEVLAQTLFIEALAERLLGCPGLSCTAFSIHRMGSRHSCAQPTTVADGVKSVSFYYHDVDTTPPPFFPTTWASGECGVTRTSVIKVDESCPSGLEDIIFLND